MYKQNHNNHIITNHCQLSSQKEGGGGKGCSKISLTGSSIGKGRCELSFKDCDCAWNFCVGFTDRRFRVCVSGPLCEYLYVQDLMWMDPKRHFSQIVFVMLDPHCARHYMFPIPMAAILFFSAIFPWYEKLVCGNKFCTMYIFNTNCVDICIYLNGPYPIDQVFLFDAWTMKT